MSHGLTLWKNGTAEGDYGTLSLASDGMLTLRAPHGSAELMLELQTSPFLDICAAPGWVCAVGAADRELVMAHLEPPSLEVIAELDRRDRGGRYDSGAHVVRFSDRPGYDQCVLAWEIGVALLDARAGTLWTNVHGDVNQRLIRITSETVELMGADTAISVSLADGTAQTRSVGKRS